MEGGKVDLKQVLSLWRGKTNLGPVRTLLREVELIWDKSRHFGRVRIKLGHVYTFWRGISDLEPVHTLRKGLELIFVKFGNV